AGLAGNPIVTLPKPSSQGFVDFFVHIHYRREEMSTSPSIQELADRQYEAGFVTDIESESLPPGLDEDVVRAISARKNEPEFLLEWRLQAYRHWLTMTEPTW